MKKSPPKSPGKAPLDVSLAQSEVANLFHWFLSLSLYMVGSPSGEEPWAQIAEGSRDPGILDLERSLGKWERRWSYNRRCFQKAVQTKATVVGDLGAVSDLFVPVMRAGKVGGFLVCGPFARQAATRQELALHWKELTGSSALESGADFVSYCRFFTELARIEGASFKALKDLLENFAAYLGGQAYDKGLKAAVARAAHSFPKSLPFRAWNYVYRRHQALLGEGRFGRLMPWDKSELGLSRRPSLALAVMLDDFRKGPQDEAGLVLRNFEFQMECLRLARDFPDTVSGRMQGGGAFFISSPDPKKNLTQSKLALRDMAASLARQLERRFGQPVLAGCSRIDGGPEHLSEAFQEAVLALHLCAHRSKALVFFDEEPAEGGSSAYLRLRLCLSRLREAADRAQPGDLRLAADEYVEEVLHSSLARAEIMRAHFYHALTELLAPVRKRELLPAAEWTAFNKKWAQRFDQAGGSHELMAAFRELVLAVLGFFESPGSADRSVRLEQAMRYISQQYQYPLEMKEVASKFGFSSSRFSRLFMVKAGMGFGPFLLKARLDKAQQMLRQSRLPIHEVASEAGFSSPSYFVQAFKRELGTTPQAYRESAS